MNEVFDPDLSATPATPTTAATERALGSLHGTVAKVLTEHLMSPGEGGLSAAMVGAAITFLKNNNITASPTENAELAALNKTLNARRRKGLSPAALKEAGEQYSAMQGSNGMPLQ